VSRSARASGSEEHVKHYEEIQTVLGELQDTVVARNIVAAGSKAGTAR
jgi:hypothetical protein